MIIFDLQCDQGHGFEGWFDSLEELESQRKRKLLTCPVCGSGKLRRVPSSFGRARKSSKPDQEMAARLLSQELVRHLRDNFEDVGVRFVSEALKIHYGVSPSRNIRGVSTSQGEDMLKKEGVEFFKFAAPTPDIKPRSEED
jgi:hypothetical protein